MFRLPMSIKWRVLIVACCALLGSAFFYLRASDATNLSKTPSAPESVSPRTNEGAPKKVSSLIPVAEQNSTQSTREQRDEKYCVDHFGALMWAAVLMPSLKGMDKEQLTAPNQLSKS